MYPKGASTAHGQGPSWPAPGLSKPTGPVKSVRSGSGLPDRFDRKPVETGQIQKIQNRVLNRFDRFTGRFDRFTGRFDW